MSISIEKSGSGRDRDFDSFGGGSNLNINRESRSYNSENDYSDDDYISSRPNLTRNDVSIRSSDRPRLTGEIEHTGVNLLVNPRKQFKGEMDGLK